MRISNIIILYYRHFIFWFLYFALARLVFIIFSWNGFKNVPSGDIFNAFPQAFTLDLSTICYILGIPFLLFLGLFLINHKILFTINKWYHYLWITTVAIITGVEPVVYQEWGTKLNYKALTYLQNPSEIFNSATTFGIISGSGIIMLMIFAGVLSYRKYFKFPELNKHYKWWNAALFLVVTPCLLALGIRGGLQPIPINQSDVYFSKHHIVNISTVNSMWNLGHSIEQNFSNLNVNPYNFFEEKSALKMVKERYTNHPDSSKSIFNTTRPNVILIILESWAGEMIESLDGLKGATPEFKKIEKEGLLFTRHYASGQRSDQGLAAIFSGYPAQPSTSIIKQESKYRNLPCINNSFRKAGYFTSFLFGGQLNYGNIKSYLYFNEFHEILEGKDLPDSLLRGRLGVHDGYMFPLFLNKIDSYQEPFFSSLFTISSHSPYDQPVIKDEFEFEGNEKPYVHSVHYTDKMLGKFIAEAKNKSWYDHTVIILMADHSHRSPSDFHVFSPAYRRIPLLITGGALKPEFRGTQISRIMAQTDFPSTLLPQLKMDNSKFNWSRNVMNTKNPEFAFYSTDYGFGYVTPENQFSYYQPADKIMEGTFNNNTNKQKDIDHGKAILQVLFQEYLEY